MGFRQRFHQKLGVLISFLLLLGWGVGCSGVAPNGTVTINAKISSQVLEAALQCQENCNIQIFQSNDSQNMMEDFNQTYIIPCDENGGLLNGYDLSVLEDSSLDCGDFLTIQISCSPSNSIFGDLNPLSTVFGEATFDPCKGGTINVSLGDLLAIDAEDLTCPSALVVLTTTLLPFCDQDNFFCVLAASLEAYIRGNCPNEAAILDLFEGIGGDGDGDGDGGTETDCSNEVDDDGDQLVDCDDPDCDSAPDCLAIPAEICDNSLDDDFDYLIDCEDPDCSADPACAPALCCSEGTMLCPDNTDASAGCVIPCDGSQECLNGMPNEEEICTGAKGNCPPGTLACPIDGSCVTPCDGVPECFLDGSNTLDEAGFICGCETVCDNGVDDDEDGMKDCEDPDCSDDPACAPAMCCSEGTMFCPDNIDAGAGCVVPCDGSQECLNGTPSEEDFQVCTGANGNCPPGTLACPIDGSCVTPCDGVPECFFDGPNSLDEAGFLCGCETVCDNGVDDDGDSMTDCDDPDCAGDPACVASSGCQINEIDCSIGQGPLDCQPICDGNNDCPSEPYYDEFFCSMGDCPGPGTDIWPCPNDSRICATRCDGNPECPTGEDEQLCGPETNCTDQIDNDYDNDIDCNDSDCAQDPACADPGPHPI